MKLILCSLIAALTLSAATITITVKNNAGVTVSNTVLTVNPPVIGVLVINQQLDTISSTVLATDAPTLKAINDWRRAKVITPTVPESKDPQGNVIPAVPAVLIYPTVDSLWKHIIGSFIRDNVLEDWLPSIIEQRRLKDVAESERKRLLEAAMQ